MGIDTIGLGGLGKRMRVELTADEQEAEMETLFVTLGMSCSVKVM